MIGAGKLNIEERISMNKMEFFLKKINLEYDECRRFFYYSYMNEFYSTACQLKRGLFLSRCMHLHCWLTRLKGSPYLSTCCNADWRTGELLGAKDLPTKKKCHVLVSTIMQQSMPNLIWWSSVVESSAHSFRDLWIWTDRRLASLTFICTITRLVTDPRAWPLQPQQDASCRRPGSGAGTRWTPWRAPRRRRRPACAARLWQNRQVKQRNDHHFNTSDALT